MEVNFNSKVTSFSQVESDFKILSASTSFISSIARLEQQAESETPTKGCFASFKDGVVGFFTKIRKLFLKICCFCIKKKYEIEVTGKRNEQRSFLVNKKCVATIRYEGTHSDLTFYRLDISEEKFAKYPKEFQDKLAQNMLDVAKEYHEEKERVMFPEWLDSYITDSFCEKKEVALNMNDGERRIQVQFKRP